MPALRFILLGGFLGAGKTTTLGKLAQHYLRQGRRVGVVTNDQAQDLVDTHLLREQGLAVEEVAGACFCCKFDDLLDKIASLEEGARPDVILAEPVGSCTDLIATVIQPLKDLYGAKFSIAPYPVVFKPSHGLKILRGGQGSGFSPKAAYIFRKQLEEADAILLNRIDELTPAQVEELGQLVSEEFPGTPVLRISAKTGDGLPALIQLLDQQGDFGRKVLNIDYDTYAEGEAELGWLNTSGRVQAPTAFALDDFLLEVVQGIQQSLRQTEAEVAHLKAIGLWEGFFGVANSISSGEPAVLSLPSHCEAREVDVIVNARVAMDPADLQKIVEQVLREACTKRGALAPLFKTQSFRPGRPTPTHRYPAAVQ